MPSFVSFDIDDHRFGMGDIRYENAHERLVESVPEFCDVLEEHQRDFEILLRLLWGT